MCQACKLFCGADLQGEGEGGWFNVLEAHLGGRMGRCGWWRNKGLERTGSPVDRMGWVLLTRLVRANQLAMWD